eukprot:scaffold576_cov260-Pinguiococcus_pyrenoidosus.AAC.87
MGRSCSNSAATGSGRPSRASASFQAAAKFGAPCIGRCELMEPREKPRACRFASSAAVTRGLRKCGRRAGIEAAARAGDRLGKWRENQARWININMGHMDCDNVQDVRGVHWSVSMMDDS